MRMKCIKDDCEFYHCGNIEKKKNTEMCLLDYGYCFFCGIDYKMDEVRDRLLELENRQSVLRNARQKIYQRHMQDVEDNTGGIDEHELPTGQ